MSTTRRGLNLDHRGPWTKIMGSRTYMTTTGCNLEETSQIAPDQHAPCRVVAYGDGRGTLMRRHASTSFPLTDRRDKPVSTVKTYFGLLCSTSVPWGICEGQLSLFGQGIYRKFQTVMSRVSLFTSPLYTVCSVLISCCHTTARTLPMPESDCFESEDTYNRR